MNDKIGPVISFFCGKIKREPELVSIDGYLVAQLKSVSGKKKAYV